MANNCIYSNQARTNLIDHIVKMRLNGLGWQQIANRFNDEDLKTFSGLDKWTGKLVANVHRQSQLKGQNLIN